LTTSSVEPSVVRRRLDGGLYAVELNRPDALNAWTPELGRQLLDAIQSAAQDEAARAILITGAGRAFSSGADLKANRRTLPDGTPDLSGNLRELYNPVMLAIAEAPKPVIAAVNGPAAGIGAALAFACDLIVAAESAYFLLAFVNVGLIPDGGSTYTLPARIGFARAAQLVLLGERLPAQRALEWGVVTEVLPDENFADRAATFARRLADGPTVALANAKLALRSGTLAGLATQLELEATLQQRQALTQDFAEGVSAFRERRSPKFTGT
jgi:2-(1,2-epoxy-1,2-dihydrophenyl)acetyl-CoA isomerase